MVADPAEVVYHPAGVTVYGGDTMGALKELNNVEVNPEDQVVTLLRHCSEEFRWARTLVEGEAWALSGGRGPSLICLN